MLTSLQDSFYKSLDAEASRKAFLNEYDFDSPDAIDFDKLVECLRDLKAGYVRNMKAAVTFLCLGNSCKVPQKACRASHLFIRKTRTPGSDNVHLLAPRPHR